ncbi:hypothetical protein ZWY2020_055711 [Hordeum vulgare]|nr:hypothetical protein ZWY2020_035583 [Hordeum vulgare]KAI5014321.1 hypothetical protein ZWY2020_055711 [Hordeum vulgare]
MAAPHLAPLSRPPACRSRSLSHSCLLALILSCRHTSSRCSAGLAWNRRGVVLHLARLHSAMTRLPPRAAAPGGSRLCAPRSARLPRAWLTRRSAPAAGSAMPPPTP